MHNLIGAEERMQRLQDMASSGKVFQRPEDDPVAVQRSMKLRNSKATTEQYLKNLSRAKSWMEYTEQALSELTTTLLRAGEISLYGITATTPQDARNIIAEEISQLREEVMTLYNRSIEGRNVLTGTMPTWKVGDDLTITADDLTALLDQSVAILEELELGLRGVPGHDAAVATSQVDIMADKVLAQRAVNGARSQRISTMETKLQALDIEYEKLVSDVEDIDLSQILVKLKSAEVAYQSALYAGSRLIQPSLLEYLK